LQLGVAGDEVARDGDLVAVIGGNRGVGVVGSADRTAAPLAGAFGGLLVAAAGELVAAVGA
jgi:hypothetical protein